SGCPNDCVAAIARADLSVIGIWKDSLKIDQEAVREYVRGGLDIKSDVCDRCPTKALTWNENTKELEINPRDCVKCMHCINTMPKALRPGDEKGAAILIGGKAPILQSAFLSWVIVPFWPREKFEKPATEFKELLRKIFEWWDENAKARERVGELIYRLGMRNFLKAVGLPPAPQMVYHPRTNPYIFYERR
ncbi:MAG: sulfite reductase, dissimilatory-type subunit alpha, partial [Nitrososphaerota archaeon]|nr:sulfite reductase, dissimilatory-type subunit alpha [Nitrososphaerota archaeon]